MGTVRLAGKFFRYTTAILTAQRKLKFGFPYTIWDRSPMTPEDEAPRLPQDDRRGVLTPQSIQYPPGMEPPYFTNKYGEHKVYWQSDVPTTFIQITEPKNARGGDVWIRS